MESDTKNDCAGEDQHQFTGLDFGMNVSDIFQEDLLCI
jgi:hypothetical protein